MKLRCVRILTGMAIALLAAASPGVAYDLKLDPVAQSVGEGARNARVTAVLSGCAEPQSTAEWTASTGPGTAPAAQAGSDFRAPSPRTFEVGDDATTVTFTVPILQDSADEPNEELVLELRPLRGAVLFCGGNQQTQTPDRNVVRARITIVDDDSPPEPPLASLQPIGDLDRLVEARTRVVLAVRAVRTDGNPAPGVTVTWSIVGDAALVGGPTSVTDDAGLAPKLVDVGGLTREVRVTASAPGVGSVVFVLRPRLDLETLFDPTLDPGPASVAEVLSNVCDDPLDAFAELCAGLTLLGPDGARRAIRELTPIEHAAALPLAVEAARRQTREVWRRQNELRHRARRGGQGRVSWNLPILPQPSTPLARSGWEAREAGRAAGGERAIDNALGRLFQSIATQTGGAGEERPAPAAEIGADESRWGLFVSGRLTTGDREATRGEPGFDYDAQGITAGIDVRATPNLFLGLAGGYDDTGGDFADAGGELSIRGTNGTAYLSAVRGGFYLDLSAGAGKDDYELERRLEVQGPGFATLLFHGRGEPGGDRTTAALAIGYDFGRSASTFGVFARGNWVDATVDGFVESPTVAGTQLEILEQSMRSLLAEAGFEWTYAASFDWGVLQPLLSASALREIEDEPRSLRGRFVGDPTGGIFTVPTDAVDESYFAAAVGLTATLTNGCGLFVLIEEEFDRDDLSALTASFGLRFEL